jgi:hypothetical protein
MPVIPIFQGAAFDPETSDAAGTAYQIARDDLRLQDHIDPLAETLAKKVVEAARTGERDPERLARLAVDALGASLLRGA